MDRSCPLVSGISQALVRDYGFLARRLIGARESGRLLGQRSVGCGCGFEMGNPLDDKGSGRSLPGVRTDAGRFRKFAERCGFLARRPRGSDEEMAVPSYGVHDAHAHFFAGAGWAVRFATASLSFS